MSKKKTGTDMIRPVPDGVKMAMDFAECYGANERASFLAGVNHVLTLNGHKPMKL